MNSPRSKRAASPDLFNSFSRLLASLSLRESCLHEMCTGSLGGGRRPARKRASSDPRIVTSNRQEGDRPNIMREPVPILLRYRALLRGLGHGMPEVLVENEFPQARGGLYLVFQLRFSMTRVPIRVQMTAPE
jgi:hypothetical protein